MAWKRLIRAYFTFNKRERQGLYVLLTLLTILLIVHAVLRFSPLETEKLSAEEKRKMEALVASLTPQPPTEIAFNADTAEIPHIPAMWVPFDPNTISHQTLVQTGLDSVLAARLIKYREKGGRYRSVSDLSKLYGMDSVWLTQAHDYLRFEHPAVSKPEKRPLISKIDTLQKPRVKLELNLADSVQLRSIPGIGAYYAREIIALRNDLKGFRSYAQLLDIYNMRDQAMENLVRHTTLDTTLVSCININTCDLETLGRHPYLTWKQARIIIAYRLQHGAFRSVRDIMRTDVIPDSIYRQVAPYLCAE